MTSTPGATDLVAVAVTTSPAGTVAPNDTKNDALPEPLVVTVVDPRNVLPSPKPVGSAVALEKNSSVKLVLATLVRVPEIWTLPLPAAVSTGKFCCPFGPLSAAVSVFCEEAGPLGWRSIPSSPLLKIEFSLMRTLAGPVAEIRIPSSVLNAIRFPSPLGLAPPSDRPIVRFVAAAATWIPALPVWNPARGCSGSTGSQSDQVPLDRRSDVISTGEVDSVLLIARD